MTDQNDPVEALSINTIRILAAEAVDKANSGHPGMPLGATPIAYVIWTKFLKHNPKNPLWSDRDRFVLSAGHASAMLYSLLHLTGYDLSIDEIKNFRQWESKTPGHPEYGRTSGVEATTGPLGQGFAMGVGMAIAERFLAEKFNRDSLSIVDHYTYAIVSDGDLMEGISSEAASLAGHLKLGKLIYVYDDNKITIEGSTSLSFTEDVLKRFEAYGWHVLEVADGEDIAAIEEAVHKAKEETGRPSIIKVSTHIGYGSPKQDDAGAHGAPLGAECLKETKKFFGWPEEPAFHIPEQALNHLRKAVDRGDKDEKEWKELFEGYKSKFPEDAQVFETVMNRELPQGWDEDIPVFSADDKAMATRSASGKVMNAIAGKLPVFMGGSADLAPSNKTLLSGEDDQSSQNKGGRNIHFGVREHAMGAVVNGMALHGGVVPYGATFLVFADYMRPSLRLASLMNINSIFVFTHDSIGVGEDGPTHQPVEHVMSIRVLPNFAVWRPADANETAEAWRNIIASGKPAMLALSRQDLPILDTGKYPVKEGVAKGAYILSDCEGTPDIIIMATGSEVSLALNARDKLCEYGIKARVVSMPCWEVFSEQPQEYRDKVLPPEVKPRLAIEAGVSHGWQRWTGDRGAIIGIDRFGASAPGPFAMEKFGFSVENAVSKAKALLNR